MSQSPWDPLQDPIEFILELIRQSLDRLYRNSAASLLGERLCRAVPDLPGFIPEKVAGRKVYLKETKAAISVLN